MAAVSPKDLLLESKLSLSVVRLREAKERETGIELASETPQSVKAPDSLGLSTF